MHFSKAIGVLAAVSALTLLGCEGEEPLRIQTVPKQLRSEIDWAVPAGWQPAAAGQMAFAAFTVAPDRPDVKVTVTRMSAPQDVLANVNRWEGQLQLPPSSPQDLPNVVRPTRVAGREAHTVDLQSPAAAAQRQRMLAAIVRAEAGDWVFKLTGPADVVGAQKANFEAFVQSVRFGPAAGNGQSRPSPVAESAGVTDWPISPQPSAAPARLVAWRAPDGWHEDKTERTMRVMTFQITPAGARGKTELAVSKFPGVGPLLSNVNRWRGDVQLPPVDAVSREDFRTATIGGSTWVLFKFTGPPTAEPRRGVHVAAVAKGGEMWFFKLLGPAEAVNAQQTNFMAFLESLRFNENAGAGG